MSALQQQWLLAHPRGAGRLQHLPVSSSSLHECPPEVGFGVSKVAHLEQRVRKALLQVQEQVLLREATHAMP